MEEKLDATQPNGPSESKQEKYIKNKANDDVIHSFESDKESILEEIKKAKDTESRVNLYAELMDQYGLEAFFGLIPVIGDLTPSIISTIYLLGEGKRIGLPIKDCLKICGYQLGDVGIGAITGIGAVADFFFKGNKYSAKIFEKHVEKLEKKAIEMGIPKDDIDKIGVGSKRFEKALSKRIPFIYKKKNRH